MASIFTKYNQLLLRRPLATNMITTGFLFGSGDYLAQKFLKHDDIKPKYDYPRTLRAVVYGSIVFAPIGDKWYKLLNKISVTSLFRGVKASATAKSVSNTIARVAADQLIFAPFVGIPLYFSVMSVFEMKSPIKDEVRRKLETSWWTTLRTNWMVWPVFQAFNFYLMPVQFRLLGVNVFSIGWNCYMSYVLNKKDSRGNDGMLESKVESEDQVMI